MAKIGFLVLYAPGHLNPSLALAKGLLAAEHEVVFFNVPDTRAAIEPSGAAFVSFGEENYPSGTLAATNAKIGELTGPAAFAYFIERMAQLLRTSFAELPSLLAEVGFDLMVVDQLFPGGATVCDRVQLPFVSLANALMVNREDVIPPPVLPWPYDPSPAGIERNRKGWAGVIQGLAPLLALVNEQRDTWDLTPYTDFLEDSFSPLLQIVQEPESFEFPRPDKPAHLHFVGHLHAPPAAGTSTFDWNWLDGRPLIYASLGTLQNRIPAIFEAIITACGALPQFQAVVALGKDALPPEIFAPAPNVKVLPFVPQAELLAHASLSITHAGLNTVLDSLQAGLPMVLMPIASEQPGIAMRVERLGAGVVVPIAGLTAESLQAAIERVHTEPVFRDAAQRMKRQIANDDPVRTAVRLIEGVLPRP